jgi:post-segregation antitoxin (ccd killing protein)
MERKNITIREDQAQWVEQADINLSQLVQDTIDEEMGPSEEDLAAAYAENADEAAEVAEEWSEVSREANEHLGPNPNAE